ncbi:beta-galactosidase [Cohnella suwonensis]|uniref:Beta-galactosidase n=1 Tax=Cohnella suwonensis TaxID=696072 RepID=A0ABW0LNT4_9BACL
MSRTVIFYDDTFPYEGERPGDASIEALSAIGQVVDAELLSGKLRDAGCLISLHGKFFPKRAWTDILALLQRGGGLLHVGDEPFRVPVNQENGAWVAEKEQTAYHQSLQIHEMLHVDPAPIDHYRANEDLPLFIGKESLFSVQPTTGFVLHVTRSDDRPGEGGSSGPMDAHIAPLLIGVSKENREVAAPAVLIENTKGVFSGGRWIFVNLRTEKTFWENGGAEALGEWGAYCRRGVTEIWLKPNYAAYEPGERANLTLQVQALRTAEDRLPSEPGFWRFEIEVTKEAKGAAKAVWTGRTEMKASGELAFAKIQVPVGIEPGYYGVSCLATSDAGEVRRLRQGFWGIDSALLREGEWLRCDRDYFRKDGRPLPIVGMTYMGSDVARKFLFMPNAAVWDRDIAQMKKAGINLIRTGIWTAWRQVMYVDGHPYEEVLRAIDAFILTAKKHDIEVTFNFFAFTPEAWEGMNPYLDPRSVEAQKRFIASIVSRHAETKNVHWDLINEPSMFNPKELFAGPRTNGDPYEQRRFAEWLEKRHGSIGALQEHWHMTPPELPDFGHVRLPEAGDVNFGTTPILPKKGGAWLDYTLFTMDMHNKWARELTETIRSIQPSQLVTVGQDEGLAGQRPSPFFYAEAVDYTTNHTWWMMDQLVWDGIFAKSPDKPNLVQETGIMYVETPDGRAKRSEFELRNILERKYAYAFSTGGAGAVQWVWNANIYMNNVNESNIGALRADGTEKPEADVSYDFGSFMGEIRDLFEGRELEDVVVVYPFSNDFSTCKLAFDATSKLTRTLVYEMKAAFRAVGEYHLESLSAYKPKLIVVPSAHNFADAALQDLLSHIEEHGGTLLYTGPIGLNEYWAPSERLVGITGGRQLGNVLREELLELEGKRLPVSFGGHRIAQIGKEVVGGTNGGGAAQVHSYAIGKGKLIWSPLPLELNERTESLVELYEYALNEAGVRPELEWKQGGELPGVYGKKVSFSAGALFVFVSEYAADATVEVTDPSSGKTYEFELQRERSVLFAVDGQGELLSVYRPLEVSIDVK